MAFARKKTKSSMREGAPTESTRKPRWSACACFAVSAGVMFVILGANAEAQGPLSDAGGQYYLICKGSVRAEGKDLAERSVLHVAAGEAAPHFDAGPEGAAVLVLSFARPSARPGSDPQALAARDPNAYNHRKD